MGKFKHVNLYERNVICNGLNQGKNPSEIAETTGRSVSTITREIKNNSLVIVENSKCTRYDVCKKSGVCIDLGCPNYCKNCTRCICTRNCNDYQFERCEYLGRSSVCNGCKEYQTRKCKRSKLIYDPNHADDLAKSRVEKRVSVLRTNEETLKIVDDYLHKGNEKGMSIYAICTGLPSGIKISEATIRRCINSGKMSVQRKDLREAPRRHPSHINEIDNNFICTDGHYYTDYSMLNKADKKKTIQVDIVEGCNMQDAAILTLHFPYLHFQMAFILDKRNPKLVIKKFDEIEKRIGTELFRILFPRILVDHGREFRDMEAIEKSINGGKRTYVYYCDPLRPEQRGAGENNHKLIRNIIPSHSKIRGFSQADIDLMMNTINSYPRKSLNGLTPYDMAYTYLPSRFLDEFNITKIPLGEIIMKPCLLEKSVI